jgi:hypothetical protein
MYQIYWLKSRRLRQFYVMAYILLIYFSKMFFINRHR